MIPGLVGRRVELELGVAGAPGKRITGLRIGFSVKHTVSSIVSPTAIGQMPKRFRMRAILCPILAVSPTGSVTVTWIT